MPETPLPNTPLNIGPSTNDIPTATMAVNLAQNLHTMSPINGMTAIILLALRYHDARYTPERTGREQDNDTRANAIVTALIGHGVLPS